MLSLRFLGSWNEAEAVAGRRTTDDGDSEKLKDESGNRIEDRGLRIKERGVRTGGRRTEDGRRQGVSGKLKHA